MTRCLTILIIGIGLSTLGPAQEKNKTTQPDANQLSKVGLEVQKSVVQIAITDPLGKETSVGAGFAVGEPGMIATNLHVIGEGRSFVVKDRKGKKLQVAEILASDRFLDLAVLRVKEKHLQPLPLADYRRVKKGLPFVAIGHPQGLENSMVQGIISSRRVIDGRDMMQVAMPVEPGNSGGPVVNGEGQVMGVVTLKSISTDNIGFAIGSDQIRKLLEKPNPVALGNWLKIGVLPSSVWQPALGGAWRKKGGRILAHSQGKGFGGRTLCLYQKPTLKFPYEVSVQVRLGEESGAAGLVFLVDDQNRHYGFYPSNSRLRLSRFEGATPFEWTVLHEKSVPAYRPGQWNELKVRLEKDKISAFVNEVPVFESKDRKLTGRKIGLAKFRAVSAEFRHFRIANKIEKEVIPPDQLNRFTQGLKSELDNERFSRLVDQAKPFSLPARERILREAEELELRVARLKKLASAIHVENIKQQLQKIVAGKDSEIDLIKAALLIARVDDPEHEMEGYVEQFSSMIAELKKRCRELKTEPEKLAELNRFLFDEHGFHGSRHEYYRPENSYLSNVLDDREGIPITLSILYMELGRGIGLSIDGIGLPGHFIVARNRQGKPPELIDVFAGGKKMTVEDAKFLVARTTTLNWDIDYLKPYAKKEILMRVLQNLRSIAERKERTESVLRYLELMLVLDPDDVSIRGPRAILLFQLGWRKKAIVELDQIIKKRPTGLDLRMIEQIKRRFEAQIARESQD